MYKKELQSNNHGKNGVFAVLSFAIFFVSFFLFGVTPTQAQVTISGTLFENDGVTPITTGKTISAAVGTSTPSVHLATSDGSGDFSISGIATSTIGSWATTTAAGNNDSWASVTYGNGLFVAVGVSGDRVMTSPDGITWTARSAAGDDDSLTGLTYGNGLFVAVGSFGDRVIYTYAGFGENIPITLFVDGDVVDATTITYGINNQSGTSTISGIDLYQDTLRLEHSTSSGVVDFSLVDIYDFDQDTDILFDSDISTTTVNAKLLVDTNTVFNAPQNLDLTTGDFENNGTFASERGNFIFSSTSAQTVSGNMTVGNEFFTITAAGSGGVDFGGNASTSNIVIQSGSSLTAPTTLTIEGDFTNNGSFINNSGSLVLTGSTTEQVFSGVMTGSSDFYDLELSNPAGVNFADKASTTFLTINESGVLMRHIVIEVADNYTSDGTVEALSGYIDLVGISKTISGSGTLGNIRVSGSYSASAAATTTDLLVASGGTFTAPASTLTIDGEFVNNGTFTHNSGELVFSGNNHFDISSTYFKTATSVSAINSALRGLALSTDGSKMFILDGNGDDLYEYDLTTPFDVTTASFVDFTQTQDSNPGGIAFSPDGFKLYSVGNASDEINQYTLTTAFDASTLSFNYATSVAAIDTNPQGVTFKPDGTKMFMTGDTANAVFQFGLTTPWDISTSYLISSTVVSAQESNPRDIVFNDNGTKLFLSGVQGDDVNEYTLTTPYDISSLTFVDSFSFAVQDRTPGSMAISSDGTNIYVAGDDTDSVYQYVLRAEHRGDLVGSNALNDVTVGGGNSVFMSVASTTDLSVEVGATLVAPTSTLSVAGSYVNNGMYDHNFGTIDLTGSGKTLSGTMTGVDNDFYNLQVSGSYTVSANASTTNLTIASGASFTAPSVLTIDGDYINNGTFIHNSGEVVSTDPGFDISVANYSTSFSIGAQDNTPDGIAFSPDGTKMFISGDQNNSLYEYTLSTPFNVTSATYVAATSTTAIEINLRGMDISPDGTKIIYTGSASDNIHMLTLSTPWDITTASYTSSISANDSNPTAVVYGYDGTKMYSLGNASDSVIQYDLGTPFDISTAVTAGSKYVGIQALNPRGIAFSIDGTVMNVTGSTDRTINRYRLNTPFDVTTAEFVYELDIASDNSSLRGLAFKADGTKMYVVDSSGADEIDSYQLDEPTFSGSMTGSSAFNDFTIHTKSEFVFTDSASTTGTFKITPYSSDTNQSTTTVFAAGSTYEFQNIDWQGASSTSELIFRSSASGTDWFLDVPGTQTTVSYVNVQDSDATLTSGGIVATNSTDSGNNTNWNFGFLQTGSSTLENHSATQVENVFNFQNKTNETLFAFKLTPNSGNATATSLVFNLSGAKKINVTDFSNIRLYRDTNSDAAYDVEDDQVGGIGVMSINGQIGEITFTGDFIATTSLDYILVADFLAPERGSFLIISFFKDDVTIIDDSGQQTIYGQVDSIQHGRNNQGGGGSSAEVGGAPPAGDGDVGGGGAGGGEEIDTNTGGGLIGSSPGFNWPSANSGSWTNPGNAYDQVDGTYATDNAGATNNFTNHGFSVPGTNTIEGIEVKLEVSGTTAAGNIGIELSWDGGTSWTSAGYDTGTLTATDAVVTVGGSSDLWGRTWTQSEFNNANFAVRVTGNPSSNTVQIDAIQVRVYHQAGGGGSGGGGGAI